MRTVPTDGFEVRYWARVTPFDATPLLHACALLYVSDMRAGSPAIQAAGLRTFDRPNPPSATLEPASQPEVNLGSLDHAMWFHAVPRVDEWFFCEVRPLTVRDSRGLVMGTMHDATGHHLATFVQEMFLKVLSPPSSRPNRAPDRRRARHRPLPSGSGRCVAVAESDAQSGRSRKRARLPRMIA